jgi:hypothetical protein
LEASLAVHLAGLGAKHDLKNWLAAERDEITISCLNGASVVEFLRHVVRCEGYSDELFGFAAGESVKNIEICRGGIILSGCR